MQQIVFTAEEESPVIRCGCGAAARTRDVRGADGELLDVQVLPCDACGAPGTTVLAERRRGEEERYPWKKRA